MYLTFWRFASYYVETSQRRLPAIPGNVLVASLSPLSGRGRLDVLDRGGYFLRSIPLRGSPDPSGVLVDKATGKEKHFYEANGIVG